LDAARKLEEQGKIYLQSYKQRKTGHLVISAEETAKRIANGIICHPF
jgi:hypothetical protein